MTWQVTENHEDVEPLRQLVKQGRLFEVQRWIAERKPLCCAGTKHHTALRIAIDSGFHSMVEVLADVWPVQADLTRAFNRSVCARQPHIARLLLERGADVNVIALSWAVETYDSTFVQQVVDAGINLSGNALANAIACRIRPAAGTMRDLVMRHPDGVAQASKALQYFVRESSNRWIGLAMWMGADPRLALPDFEPSDNAADEEDDSEDEEYETALQSACREGNLLAVKMFKVDPSCDDLNQLLSEIRAPNTDLVEYLLELGADINNKPNGGSSLLDSCLHDTIGRCYYWSDRKRFSMDQFDSYVARGAKLVPDDSYAYRCIRENIIERGFHSHKQILKLLATCCSPEVFHRIIASPKLRMFLNMTPTKILKKYGVPKPPKREHTPRQRRHRPPKAATSTVSSIPPTSAAPEVAECDVCAPDETFSREPLPKIHPVAPRRRSRPQTGEVTTIRRSELHAWVWRTAMCQLKEQFGVSDVALAKACKRYDIPRPGRGYWAKRQNGHDVPTLPLPSRADDPTITISRSMQDDPVHVPGEQRTRAIVSLPADMRGLHPLITQTRSARARNRQIRKNSWHHLDLDSTPQLKVNVDREHEEQAFKLVDVVIQTVQQYEGEVVIEDGESRIRLGEKDICFSIYQQAGNLIVLSLHGDGHGFPTAWSLQAEAQEVTWLSEFVWVLLYLVQAG